MLEMIKYLVLVVLVSFLAGLPIYLAHISR